MKMKLALAVAVSLLLGSYVYAANGDLIVNGKIGVGTTTPWSKLSVGGNGITDAGIYGTGIAYGVYGAGAHGVHGESASIGVYGKSTSTGYSGTGVQGYGPFGVVGEGTGPIAVGVQGTSAITGVRGSGLTGVAGLALQTGGTGVNGNGYAYDFYASGSGVNYGASSSVRWKKNVKEIDNALAIISGLRGVSFDWDEEHGGQHDIGFIGEEVGKKIPEIVVWDESDKQYITGMDYSKMTPVLLQAIKEQQKQIEVLKAEVQALKKRVARN